MLEPHDQLHQLLQLLQLQQLPELLGPLLAICAATGRGDKVERNVQQISSVPSAGIQVTHSSGAASHGNCVLWSSQDIASHTASGVTTCKRPTSGKAQLQLA